MRNDRFGSNLRESSLHLTIQSSEIIKRSLSSDYDISLSCDISEVPSINCTVVFTRKDQDIGKIGSIKFQKDRPTANARINISTSCFAELRNLLTSNPPRPASLYLQTSKYTENSNGDINLKNSGKDLTIFDVSWRYPVL